MVLTPSSMPDLGITSPDFNLPNVLGGNTKLKDFDQSSGLLVAFICNHCPYVVHIIDKLTTILNQYQSKGIGVVCISSNNVDTHPDDSPEKMAKLAKSKGFEFPYLFDETQDIAKAYKAECTPDFFLFDHTKKLVYRGQFDDSRPGNAKAVTGRDLIQALEALLNKEPPLPEQKPSIGCNIKWRG